MKNIIVKDLKNDRILLEGRISHDFREFLYDSLLTSYAERGTKFKLLNFSPLKMVSTCGRVSFEEVIK